MSNLSKWLIAVPFTLLVSLLIPAIVAGELFWFLSGWADVVYSMLTAAMWLAATAFVDVTRPRSEPDLANRLIPLGLILSVPISVWDRTHWLASRLPVWLSLIGALVGVAAILIGVSARRALGGRYSPRAGHQAPAKLVTEGPYRFVRHPLYLAALLWAIGWPLLIASMAGSLTAIGFILPGVLNRVQAEEKDLLQVYGKAYAAYRKRTWRLIPGVF